MEYAPRPAEPAHVTSKEALPATVLTIPPGLHLIQRGVATAHFDKLVVAASFDDAPIIQHENLVGQPDG